MHASQPSLPTSCPVSLLLLFFYYSVSPSYNFHAYHPSIASPTFCKPCIFMRTARLWGACYCASLYYIYTSLSSSLDMVPVFYFPFRRKENSEEGRTLALCCVLLLLSRFPLLLSHPSLCASLYVPPSVFFLLCLDGSAFVQTTASHIL